MRISFLHTIESNQAVFANAAAQAGLPATQLRHVVRPDLRQAVDQRKMSDDEIHDQIRDTVRDLAATADTVIITCATLGPIVDAIAEFAVPIIRADVALADAASRDGKNIVVLCAVESTVEANRTLFGHYAAATGARITVRLVPGVWASFQSGDIEACLQACAQAAQDAYQQGADVVALAHPWMAAAVGLVQSERKPMDSARAALRAAGAAKQKTPGNSRARMKRLQVL